MSNYGRKTYSPEQVKEMWRESTEKEAKIAKSHDVTKKLAEKKPDLSKPQSYFDNHKTHKRDYEYDKTFCINEGYNQKLKRDDMQHTQGLNIRGEEENKPVPILSNSVYGKGAPLESMTRDYVRVAVVRRQFYRSSGIGIQHS